MTAHLLLGTVAMSLASIASTDVDEGWSKSVGGIEARITLDERPKVNGTREIVPYLELRNVSDVASPIRVPCGNGHVEFELLDREGEVVRGGWRLPRSGPHADPGTVILPFDSSIRIGMHCCNWGVPKDAAAMVATDSGAWVLQPEERGKVFLRATITSESDPESQRTWEGTIVTSPIKISWDE